ncbi:MAG: MFS transporter [Oscillospiraceae bacterium]|jgi:DHA3 family macrolide efflux protein-like MFS transporter|nr:MFS transporter [Oscillospiraceae bacterium]
MSEKHWRRRAGLYIGGQFLSNFGSMLVQFAVTWYVTLETDSGATMTWLILAAMLPTVLIMPFAGVWADRHNRKYLVNGADSAIALVTLILALLFISGQRSIGLLLVAAVLRALGQGIQTPAASALIPQLVPAEHLTRFNGIQNTLQAVTAFLSPMAAGAVLSILPLEFIFFIDVATAVVGIAIVFFCVKVDKIERKAPVETGARAYLSDMRQGLGLVKRTKWLQWWLGDVGVFSFLAAPLVLLTPLLVARSFGDDVWRLTLCELIFSAGAIVAGVGMSVWGGLKNKAHTMIVSTFLIAATTIFLGLVPNFWSYLVVLFISGLALPMFNIPSMTILQTKVAPDMMGRVFSLMNILSGLAMPLGMVFFGPLGDRVPIEALLIATGGAMLVNALALTRAKSLIAAGAG